MTRIPLPHLADGTPLHPARLSVTLTLRPASRATMLLPPGERVSLRQRVTLYTPQGCAGSFRVTAVEEVPGEGCEVTLRHGSVSLGDALIPGVGEFAGPARQVLARLLGCQTGETRWTLGDVELPDDRPLSCAYSHSNLLTALENLLDELPEYGLFFEESGGARLMHLRLLPGDDACECRLSRNLRSLEIARDDSDLCTRVYMNSLAAPIDADSTADWGIVARHLTANRRLSTAALTTIARQYLAEHSEPYLTVRLDAADLHLATGEALDRFPVGRMCRVALPDDGAVIRQRVISVTYGDVYGDPERATVTLANRQLDTADYVGGLMANVNVLYRGLADADGLIRLEGERIELLAGEIQLKASSVVVEDLERRATLAEITLDGFRGEIALKASQQAVNLLGERVSQAEIDIRGAQAEILLRASREEVGLLTERLTQAEIDIDGARGEIALKASQESLSTLTGRVTSAEATLTVQAHEISTKVSAGGVASAINQTAQSVLIQASKINLSGYVTTSVLEANLAAFMNNVTIGTASIDYATIRSILTGSLNVGNSVAGWKSLEVVTGVSLNRTYNGESTYNFRDHDNARVTITVPRSVAGVTAEVETETIHYLGR